MRNQIVNKKIVIVFLVVCFFASFAQAENKVINIDDLQKTGLSQEEINQIKKTAGGESFSVNPEITSPSLGSVVSGKEILFKGVATPSVNITVYIKDIDHVENNTIVGKTKTDNFGVWTYSLSSELEPSNYTVMATANDPKLGTVNSEIVRFSIISQVRQNNNQMQIKNLSSSQDTERLLFIVIIVGMVSFTFLVAFIILMTVFYLKEKQKVTKINLKKISEEDLDSLLKKTKEELDKRKIISK